MDLLKTWGIFVLIISGIITAVFIAIVAAPLAVFLGLTLLTFFGIREDLRIRSKNKD